MPINKLYLAVLPFIHIGDVPFRSFGQIEQVLTLFPDRRFATEFFPDEVEGYMKTFKSRADRFLIGGHVLGYELELEKTEDGRVVVQVVQIVG